MDKKLAFIFSFIAMLMLVGVGISLSYRSLLFALLFLVLWFFIVGAGFIVKSKTKKLKSNEQD